MVGVYCEQCNCVKFLRNTKNIKIGDNIVLIVILTIWYFVTQCIHLRLFHNDLLIKYRTGCSIGYELIGIITCYILSYTIVVNVLFILLNLFK